PNVQKARAALIRILRKQMARVYVLNLPVEHGINGPDDLIGCQGDAALARVFEGAKGVTTNTRKLYPLTLRSPEYSDDALALLFTEKYCDDLRYVAPLGRWYRWTGTVWAEDSTLHVYDLVRQVCRNTSLEVQKSEAIARKLASAMTVAAVERLA